MRRLARLWRQQKLAVIGFAISLLVVGFFAVRIVISAIYWSDPAHLMQQPEPWMTPGYIARSWHLDRHEVTALVGEIRVDGRPTVARIARERGIPTDQFIDTLSQELRALQAGR